MKYCIFWQEIYDRFRPCLQCIFIVSVMLWFKIVVFMLGKAQSTCTEVIHRLGCVRTLSPGIYCICSINILEQESLWLFWSLKKSVVRVRKQFSCHWKFFGRWMMRCDFLSFTCRAFDLWSIFFHFSWWTFDCFACVTIWLEKKHLILSNLVC